MSDTAQLAHEKEKSHVSMRFMMKKASKGNLVQENGYVSENLSIN